MKRAISFIIVLAMTAMLFTVFALNSSAAVPDGQIWEGEDDLRTSCTENAGNILLEGQDIIKHDNKNENGLYSSYGQHLFWRCVSVNDYIEFTLEVEVSGPKTFYVKLLKAADYGIFDFYWDNELIGDNIDTYSSITDTVRLDLGTRYVTPGTHRFRIQSVGINNASAFNINSEKPRAYCGLDYLEILDANCPSLIYTAKDNDNFGKITILNDGTIRYECEKMIMSEESLALYTTSEYRTQYYQKYGVLSFGWHFLFVPLYAGLDFKLQFEVAEDGEYSASVNSLTAPEFGTVYFKIDDTVISDSIDQYSTDFHTVKTDARNIMLKAGTHTLSIYVDGSNDLSTGFRASADCLDLLKVGEYKDDGGASDTSATSADTSATSETPDLTDTTTEKPNPGETPAPTDSTTEEPNHSETPKVTETTPAQPSDTTPVPAETTTTTSDKSNSCGGTLGYAVCIIAVAVSVVFIAVVKKNSI